MTVQTTTHINRRGDARALLEFYHAVFGGELMMLSYRDAGAVQDPDEADQIMWGQVAAPSGIRVMAYDVPGRMDWDAGEIPFFLSVRGDDADELRAMWDGLSAEGTVLHPLGPAPWSSLYGMARDRFGVTWVMDVAGAP